jgi:hypothetical protein
MLVSGDSDNILFIQEFAGKDVQGDKEGGNADFHRFAPYSLKAEKYSFSKYWSGEDAGPEPPDRTACKQQVTNGPVLLVVVGPAQTRFQLQTGENGFQIGRPDVLMPVTRGPVSGSVRSEMALIPYDFFNGPEEGFESQEAIECLRTSLHIALSIVLLFELLAK